MDSAKKVKNSATTLYKWAYDTSVAEAYAEDIVKEMLEQESQADYVLSYEFVSAVVNWEQSNTSINMYYGTELAKNHNWTDDTLLQHFLAVEATYDAEYSTDALWTQVEGKEGKFRFKTLLLVVEESDGSWYEFSTMPFGKDDIPVGDD